MDQLVNQAIIEDLCRTLGVDKAGPICDLRERQAAELLRDLRSGKLKIVEVPTS